MYIGSEKIGENFEIFFVQIAWQCCG